MKTLSQKSERPVGVPAALAWGMEGIGPEAGFVSLMLWRGWPLNCARQQQNDTQD